MATTSATHRVSFPSKRGEGECRGETAMACF